MARWQCPKCGKTPLMVQVTVSAMLYQDRDGYFETELEGGDHEWDETSVMRCVHCGHAGEAHEFDTEKEDEM